MKGPDASTRRRIVLGGVGTVLAGGGIVYAGATLQPGETAVETAPAPFHASSKTTRFGIDLRGHPVMGSLDAPIDMYYWSDYQCPFCRRFEQNAFPKLVEDHVQSGTVRVVFLEYPYIGAGSMTAAVMDRCVWRQVRNDTPAAYWRWHTTIFDEQGTENAGWATRDRLLDVTSDVAGVNAGAVESCMDERRSAIEASIDEEMNRASRYGISGTPAFILYNRHTHSTGHLVGAQPYDRFDEAVTRIQNA